MIFTETELQGVWLIQPERHADERGFLARTFCEEEFHSRGLPTRFVQSTTAYTQKRGTLRGLHYQAHPHWETKLIRCTRGEAFVVVVNVDANSPQHTHWIGERLSPENGNALLIPAGFAQGYQTLSDSTELLYQMTEPFHPSLASGYAWNDPAFQIEWPLPAENLSPKDRSWEPYA